MLTAMFNPLPSIALLPLTREVGLCVAHNDRRGTRIRAGSGSGGPGWYIFENRNELYADRVFAGLAAVVVIGLLIEHLVFDTLERVSVRRWGVQH